MRIYFIAVTALVLVGLVLPGADGASGPPARQDSPFGIVCPWGHLKDAGISWVRCGAGATALGNWANIHKGPAQFDWKSSDSELYGVCNTENLSPLVILGYTPDWLSTGEKDKSAYPPKDYLQYADFVKSAVTRYKANINYWEIWNEPDIGFWKGSIPQYVNLLKTGYCAVKAADPKARVVFGGLAGVNLRFLEEAYDYGAGPFFDVMAVHPYQWGDTFNDDWFVSQLVELRRTLNKHGDPHKPIWLTEFGWSTGDANITPEVQARLLTQSVTTAMTLRDIGVEKLFWFSVKDWGGPGHGIIDKDSKPKPAYKAYKTLIKYLKGLDYLGSQDVGEFVRFHVFGKKDGGHVGVLWSTDKEPHLASIWAPGLSSVHVYGFLGDDTGVVGTEGPWVHWTTGPDPQFVLGKFGNLDKGSRKDWPRYLPSGKKETLKPSGVWMTVCPQDGTARPYVVRGKTTDLELDIQNQTQKAVSLALTYQLDTSVAKGALKVSLPALSSKKVPIKLTVPANEKLRLARLIIKQAAPSPVLASVSTPVRVSDGKVIEFLGNSYLDESYLVGDQRGSGAPSIRFGGGWAYKLPFASGKKVKLQALVGSNGGSEWSVQTSSDGTAFTPVMRGKDGRSLQTGVCSTDGKALWLRFDGKDTQLEELVAEETK